MGQRMLTWRLDEGFSIPSGGTPPLEKDPLTTFGGINCTWRSSRLKPRQ